MAALGVLVLRPFLLSGLLVVLGSGSAFAVVSPQPTGRIPSPSLGPSGAALDAAGPMRLMVTSTGARVDIGLERTSLLATSLSRGGRSIRDLRSLGAPVISGDEIHSDHGGIREWWRAAERGLEHGVTLDARPPGEGPLRIQLTVAGTLRPEPIGDDAVALVDARGITVATYSHLVVLDAARARLPARLDVADGPDGFPSISIELDDAHAEYPVVVDPLLAVAEEERVGMGAPSGACVAITADGVRAVVGRGGRARVYLRTGTAWAEEAALVGPAGVLPTACPLAITADGVRAVVGGDINPSTGAGNARVFVRTGTAWTQEAVLEASPGVLYDGLGSSVAINADGTRVLLGGPTDASQRGTAWVFQRSGSVWTEEARLVATDGIAGDEFGTSVAISADGSRALIGAMSDDTVAGSDAGSAHLFVRTGTSWIDEATLLASDAESSEYFGSAVALSGDASRAFVGAYNDSAATGFNVGSVRVFVRSGTSWAPEATLLATVASSYEFLGTALGISADGTRVVAGAPGETFTGSGDNAHVFERLATGWVDAATLRAPVPTERDQFGWGVALASDGTRALVGAPGEDGPTVGSVRVYTLVPGSANGRACTTGATCLSDLCVDGVCCESACGGGAGDCQGCAAALTGGADGVCGPLSSSVAPSVTCRAAAGACDVAEFCSPAGVDCPADELAPAGISCRPARSSCDAVESCSGTAPSCPVDVPAPATQECRPTAGPCDVAEHCTGTSFDCGPDRFAASTVGCRIAIGPCDVDEDCDGTSAACPVDGTAPAGTVCRPSTASCDVSETCDGVATGCPDDVTACIPPPDGGPRDGGGAPPDDAGPRTSVSGCACRSACSSRGAIGPPTVALVPVLAVMARAGRRKRASRPVSPTTPGTRGRAV